MIGSLGGEPAKPNEILMSKETQWLGAWGPLMFHARLFSRILHSLSPWLWPCSFAMHFALFSVAAILATPVSTALFFIMILGVFSTPVWMLVACFPAIKKSQKGVQQSFKEHNIVTSQYLSPAESTALGIFGYNHVLVRVNILVHGQLNPFFCFLGPLVAYTVLLLANLLVTPVLMLLIPSMIVSMILTPVWWCIYTLPVIQKRVNHLRLSIDRFLHEGPHNGSYGRFWIRIYQRFPFFNV